MAIGGLEGAGISVRKLKRWAAGDERDQQSASDLLIFPKYS